MTTKSHVRWCGTGLSASALAVFLSLQGTVYVDPAHAAACCQSCEAQETACFAACDETSHDSPDTAQACHDSCLYDLYEGPGACWANCIYCEPPPQAQHYCCLVVDHGEEMQGWRHVLDCWEVSSSCI